MEKIPIYHQGSSIALLIRAKNRDDGSPVEAAGYDVEGILYTRLVGGKITLSTTGTPLVPVHIADSVTFSANIPADMTEMLSPGECTLQLAFIDKNTGAKHIEAKKLMILEHTVKQ